MNKLDIVWPTVIGLAKCKSSLEKLMLFQWVKNTEIIEFING